MTESRPRATAALTLLVALLAVAAFLPVLWNGFVDLDDTNVILRNERFFLGPPGELLAWALTDTSSCNWYPLARLSHVLDARLFGMNPGGHHLTSLLLHAANAAILFRVLLAATGVRRRSLAVAALFAVHPLQTESVAWAAERSNLLAGLFSLLAIAAYLRWVRAPSPKRFAPVLGGFLLALMAKPTAVVLPVALLVLDFWPLGRLAGRIVPLLREKAPLFLAAAAAALVTLRTQGECGALRSLDAFPLAVRLLSFPLNLASSLVHVVWPVGLQPLYEHPGAAVSRPLVLASALGIGALSVLAWCRRRERPVELAGWLWFLVPLLPVSGLIQAGDQAIADRFAYLALVGPAAALVWGLAGAARTRLLRVVLAAAAVASVAALAAASVRQTRHWADPIALGRRVVALSPRNFFAHEFLSTQHFRRGEYDEAIREVVFLLTEMGDVAILRANLAEALDARGDLDAAIHHFGRAVALAPENGQWRERLEHLRARRERAEADAARFETRLLRNPKDLDARRERGTAFFELGRFGEAAAEFRVALALDPRQPDVADLLGRAERHRPNPEELALRNRDGAGSGDAAP